MSSQATEALEAQIKSLSPVKFTIFSHRTSTQAINIPNTPIFITFNYSGIAQYRVDTSAYDHWQDVYYDQLTESDCQWLNQIGLTSQRPLTSQYREKLLEYGFIWFCPSREDKAWLIQKNHYWFVGSALCASNCMLLKN